MNNAEMRSRLTRIGLSLNQLSTITGWDYRELRRTANGIRDVSPRTIEMIEQLEAVAADLVDCMQESVDRDEPVGIPYFSDEGRAPYFRTDGVMPGSFWHAIAGMVLSTNDHATVEYDPTAAYERSDLADID